MDRLYRLRSWIASAPSFLFFLVAAILTIVGTPKPPAHKPDRSPMRVTIAQPPAEPTPPPPAPAPELPQMIAPPTPDIVLPPMPKLSQRPTAKPVPAQTAQATQNPQPAAEPTTAPSAAATAPARPQAAAAAGEDDAYTARLRGYLESIKHYPTSKEARLQRPRGTVEVWFVLDRSGGMKDAGIETSSGSLILDGAALSLVRGASYPAFPPDAFKNEVTRRFTVHLNYTLS